MGVIVWSSEEKYGTNTSGYRPPRYEIGGFFITVYFAHRSEALKAKQFTSELTTCLGKEGRIMCVNLEHPSQHGLGKNSNYMGTHEEMHEGESGSVVMYDGKPTTTARYNHWHVELAHEQRNTAFSEEEMDTIKLKLKEFSWG
ncbi:MAG: hypothetical protein QM776_01560 [Rhodocyclaceae bacterium]